MTTGFHEPRHASAERHALPSYKKADMKRLSIDITPEQHQNLKAAAANQGESIQSDVLERALPDPEEQSAFAKLESMLAKRVHLAQAGHLLDKSLDDVFDEEIQKAL